MPNDELCFLCSGGEGRYGHILVGCENVYVQRALAFECTMYNVHSIAKGANHSQIHT